MADSIDTASMPVAEDPSANEQIKNKCRHDAHELKEIAHRKLPPSSPELVNIDYIYACLSNPSIPDITLRNEPFASLIPQINELLQFLEHKRPNIVLIALFQISAAVTSSITSSNIFLRVGLFSQCLTMLKNARNYLDKKPVKTQPKKPIVMVAPFHHQANPARPAYQAPLPTRAPSLPNFSVCSATNTQPATYKQVLATKPSLRVSPYSHRKMMSNPQTDHLAASTPTRVNHTPTSRITEFPQPESSPTVSSSTEMCTEWPDLHHDESKLIVELLDFEELYAKNASLQASSHQHLHSIALDPIDLKEELEFFGKISLIASGVCPLLQQPLHTLKEKVVTINQSNTNNKTADKAVVASFADILQRLQLIECKLSNESWRLILVLMLPDTLLKSDKIQKSLWITSHFIKQNHAEKINRKVSKLSQLFDLDAIDMARIIGKEKLGDSLVVLEYQQSRTKRVQHAINADQFAADYRSQIERKLHKKPSSPSVHRLAADKGASHNSIVHQRPMPPSVTLSKQYKQIFMTVKEFSLCVFSKESLEDEIKQCQKDVLTLSLSSNQRGAFTALGKHLQKTLQQFDWHENTGGVQAAIISLMFDTAADITKFADHIQQSHLALTEPNGARFNKIISAKVMREGTTAYQMALLLNKPNLAARLKPKSQCRKWMAGCNIQ